jgi:hypothetical protein
MESEKQDFEKCKKKAERGDPNEQYNLGIYSLYVTFSLYKVI